MSFESLPTAGDAALPDGPTATDDRRFRFGRNWASFLRLLNEDRIAEAERSLRDMLEVDNLAGRTFLDVGCGSGLFSLAAMRLGARRVHSFDFDSQSVECARELRRRYFPHAGEWTIEAGSALDSAYLTGLGRWDVVYSWGVLHHTGRMWEAIDRVTNLVATSGVLFISIYNDQGWPSEGWRVVKRIYNRGAAGKAVVLAVFIPYFAARGLLADLVRLRDPLRRYRDYHRSRGMSPIHDWVDWLGGYPFDVAKPEQVLAFCRSRGFALERLTTCGGRLGCNEYVFRREVSEANP